MNQFKSAPHINKHRGFTLLENLIAMIILAIGLLGLASIQIVGLQNNQSAYTRSQATYLAYDMADRIRVNLISARNFSTSVYVDMALIDADSKPNCKAQSGACSPDDMAENDLFEWRERLAAALPSGTGAITTNGTVYNIAVTWDDRREPAGDANNSADTTFQMSFQL